MRFPPGGGEGYNIAITTATIDRATPAAPAATATRYVLGPVTDALLLGPGATLLVTGVVLALAGAGATGTVALVTLALNLVFVGPHYAATWERAYSSRDIIRDHPVVTLVVPPVLAAAAFLAVRHPATFGLAYFGTYVLWAGYHYSGQSRGLLMLYPLRQGARFDVTEKRLFCLPLYVSWILSVLGLFRLTGSARNPAYEAVRQAWHGPPLPAWVTIAGLAALAASFAGVAVVARRRRARGVPVPWPSYAVLSAQVAWFTAGLFNPFFNITLVPIFHSMQYLALTSWHTCHGRGEAGPRRFALYAVVTLALGFFINPGLFAFFGHGRAPGDVFVITAAVATFVNLHHFLLDGRIWRLRERRVVQSMVG
jgi:hypothetical protein